MNSSCPVSLTWGSLSGVSNITSIHVGEIGIDLDVKREGESVISAFRFLIDHPGLGLMWKSNLNLSNSRCSVNFWD